jgi:hypothetical protein
MADLKSKPGTSDADSASPKVLGVRFGVNPNSSSLGVDVTFLLFGGTAAIAASMALSAWLRGFRRKADVVGEPPPHDEESGAVQPGALSGAALPGSPLL